MDDASKQRQKATDEATSLSNLSRDLPTLLAKLRRILLKKSENNDEIDSQIIQYIESIKIKIQDLSKLSEPTQIFDLLQAVLKIYINDLLSITKASNILSNKIFQEIFTTINQTECSLDLLSTFENNPTYARKVFYGTFDLLASPIITDFLQEKYPVNLSSHLAHILRKILNRIDSTTAYIFFEKNSLHDQIQTIRLVIEYIDRNKQKLEHSETVDVMLSFLSDLVDDTMLVPAMIEAGLSDNVLIWISFTDLSMNTVHCCLYIIYNIARHEQGIRTLNDANCLPVLKVFKKSLLDPNKDDQNELYTSLRLLYCMILSSLTEPKENREDLNNLRKTLDQLMQLVIDAGQSDNKKYGAFHVSEPLVVLTKLFVHDDILKYVLDDAPVRNMTEKSKLQFFCHLSIKFRGALASTNDLDQLTLAALLNLIWSISFHDKYIEELKSTPKFLITMKSLANDDGEAWVSQYVPKTMASIQKAANGILWNLDEDNPARVNKTITKVDALKMAEASNRIRVMVSYCHADSDFCHQLVGSLQKDNRFEVWVDFEYCHTEDLWEEIGEAIEKADVILFLMSKDYQDSKSCRQEVMYTKDSLKKRFIPIYTKKDFVATSWLGVRIVGPQYIRFGKKSFDETMNELIKLIVEDRKEQEAGPVKDTKPPPVVVTDKPTEIKEEPMKIIEPNSTAIPVNTSDKPVEKWTKKDIIQWFENNHIQQELVNLYDFQHGTDLLLYRQCLRPDWEREYNDIKRRYEQNYHSQLYRDQFVRFVGAMHRLPQSTSSSHSKTCVIS